MKAAANRAAENESSNDERDALVRELEEVSIQKKQMEKREKWLKSQLMDMMNPGERIGLVELAVQRPLDISDELLDSLEQRYGAAVVKRSVNTKFLRALMDSDQELDREIPRIEKRMIRVGEKWSG